MLLQKGTEDKSWPLLGPQLSPNPDFAGSEHTYVWVNIFKDLFNGAVLFNQIDGSLGADALNSTAVVAAEEDAQVYKLK